ncbi:hypothetical protein KEJ34_09210 [Candidatus Bathyarchaeota archaeon]|nr:hypothetical protein [Candidatus Bathyarchaeota archaeon]
MHEHPFTPCLERNLFIFYGAILPSCTPVKIYILNVLLKASVRSVVGSHRTVGAFWPF